MNKIDLIERLLDEKKINFKEAFLLMEEEQVKDLTPPVTWRLEEPGSPFLIRLLEAAKPKPLYKRSFTIEATIKSIQKYIPKPFLD